MSGDVCEQLVTCGGRTWRLRGRRCPRVDVRLAVLVGEDTVAWVGFRTLAAGIKRAFDLHVCVPNLCQLVNAALTRTSTTSPDNRRHNLIHKISKGWEYLSELAELGGSIESD